MPKDLLPTENQRASEALKEAQKNWKQTANQRLEAISRGEWSPWLTLKMMGQSLPLRHEEAYATPDNTDTMISNPMTDKRMSVWDQMKAQAEAGKYNPIY